MATPYTTCRQNASDTEYSKQNVLKINIIRTVVYEMSCKIKSVVFGSIQYGTSNFEPYATINTEIKYARRKYKIRKKI